MEMFSLEIFNGFLIGMIVVAVIVFFALQYVEAGYGMMYNRRWGISINNRIGWILMESPVFFAMIALWWFSDRRHDSLAIIFLLIFELHYFQRSFIFPLMMRGNNRMPLSIICSGIFFNLLNALMQGGWLFYFAPDDMYSTAWLLSPQFISGLLIFACGMIINIHSDSIIRNLRKPGDTRHYIPQGGMFKYVSSANYLGELLEWIGFAILTWSAAGAVFAIWTFANLAPRAKKINCRYEKEFGTEFTKLKLKSILPYIY
ncbi:MAG: DUF1295 domain-containing protein [Muribaculaceae bacterium]|nr:DUF1295 domain-containing protein [Muribaculaceae bacterium]